MFRKIILTLMILAVFVSVELVFAQEEEVGAERQQMRRGQERQFEQDRPVKRSGRGVGQMRQKQRILAAYLDRWLGGLTRAYHERDHEKMGQLLRRINQARQKVQQRGQQFVLGEKGFRKGRGAGQGGMRRGKVGRKGLRADRMERFSLPMGERGPLGKGRRGVGRGGQGRRRNQAGAMGRRSRGMGGGGQRLGHRARRMYKLREHVGQRLQDRRPFCKDFLRDTVGSRRGRGPRW